MKRVGVTLFTAAAFFVVAPAASAHHSINFALVGTAGTNGWYRSNVTIQWQMSHPADITASSGCEPGTQVTSEGLSSRMCSVSAGDHTVNLTVNVRIDKTAPSAAGAASRGPDSNGWYNHPVSFSFSGTDAVSGIAGCSNPTYGGGDGGSVAVSGTCVDVAGNTSAAAVVGFQYDATPPAVSASPDAPPTGAWYRKPVVISFGATDATSGVGSCTAPVRYKGPDVETASVKGSCTDAAGNSAEVAYSFKYDATAPKLGKLNAATGKGQVSLSWGRAPDVATTQLIRSPGLKGAKSSVIYRGARSAFVDRSVREGTRYRYNIVVGDVAGNLSGRVVTIRARRPLYQPALGQRVRGPLTLAWEPVQGARFYNVQLLRDGVKVLSDWPRKSFLRVNRSWRYAGKTQRLLPGRYLWYVWPAEGTIVRPRFGRPIGNSSFVVRGGA